MTRQSEDYVMTITARNDPKLLELREKIKLNNAGSSTKLYVKLQARGHRYGNRKWHQALPLDYGTSFDVYVYER